jgi:hypothetical protein
MLLQKYLVLAILNVISLFSHSPIGTWGTVLYPLIWQAFREWWLWREQFRVQETGDTLPPFVDFDILTNHYYNQNPSIWSPWHIRFAYETGAKCLYPNLPGNLSLVSNHRERGVNYVSSLGSRTSTVASQHIQSDTGNIIFSEYGTRNQTPAKLWNFPAYSSLVHQQYDFSLRRAGRNLFSQDSMFVRIEEPDENRELENNMKLSLRHWHLISDMLQFNLEHGHTVLHIEPGFSSSYLIRLGLDAEYLAQHGMSIDNILISSECGQWYDMLLSGDFRDCFSLPNIHDLTDWSILLSNLSLYRSSIQLVVVQEKSALQVMGGKLHSLWVLLENFTFALFLVLGTCVSAPTSLSLTAHSDTAFSIVEDVCSELMWTDAGAVLYGRVDVNYNNSLGSSEKGEYYAVVKRHEGSIISRRFRKAFSLLND